jgi:hypothetical protein
MRKVFLTAAGFISEINDGLNYIWYLRSRLERATGKVFPIQAVEALRVASLRLPHFQALGL